MDFGRRIKHLDHRVRRLEETSARFSWIRLAMLIAIGALVWLAAELSGAAWGWRIFFAGLAVFIIVALLHRRLDAAIEQFRRWRSIQIAHRSRLELDWEGLHPAIDRSTAHPRLPLDVDLDLTGERSIHRLIDCAASVQGSRLLAEWLTLGWAAPDEVHSRQNLVRELQPMQLFRDRLTLAFLRSAKEHLDGDKLLGWLSEVFPVKRLRWALPVSILWSALNLLLFTLAVFGRIPAVWPLSLTFYLAFYYFNIRVFQQILTAIVDLDGELSKFRPPLRLIEKRLPPSGAWRQRKPHLAKLIESLLVEGGSPSQQLRRISWLTAGVGLRSNPILGVLLNLVLPWDYVFAALAAAARQRLCDTLPEWFRAVYTLEAASSLANLAALHPEYTYPVVDASANPVFQVEGIAHPLLHQEGKVTNDFTAGNLGSIAIITGSNMAGKSTFIKAIGVNLSLAYAGGPVDARRLHTRPFRLYTVIRISDSISEGYSYFYAEVRRLKGLLDLLDGGGAPVLYLVDEIFRGTNNRERLIGSRATLRALMTKNGVGLLATHDLELATLAQENPQVSNYHFRDDVRDGHLVFDYTMRAGPSPTTNALKIMQMEGLPVESSEAAATQGAFPSH